MSIAPYIRVIGRGKDGARSLDAAQSHDLMSQLLDGRLSDLEIGAFALAMRIKGESVAELSGFLRAVHGRCITLPAPRQPLVMLPSYNGARKLPNLAPLLALLLAREGVDVLMHGPLLDAGRVASAEILTALGLPVCSDAAQVQAAWQRQEPAFLPIDALCPPLARLLDVRRVVGLRNPGHTLAKLLAPLPGALRLVSFTHPEYAALLGEFLAQERADAMLLRGTEGEAVADARRRPALQVFIDGQPRADLSHAAQAGSLAVLPDLPREHDAATTAEYTRQVLAGIKPLPEPIATQVATIRQALAAL
ncbi:MAG: DNA-binding protein YbiB [Rubrivivax sp.]